MKLKGSYTVEASFIICFCFIIFGIAVGIAYELFQSTLEYVQYKEGAFDAVNVFRVKEGLIGVIHAIKD